MPTTTDVADLMKPVFDTARTAQEMWLETMRIRTELGQRIWSGFFGQTGDGDPPSRAEIIDISFEHARRLIGVQEACVGAMVGDGNARSATERNEFGSSAPSPRTAAEGAAA